MLAAPEAAALKAGRLMLNEIEGCVNRRESFAIETTLSGMGYLARIRQWRSMSRRWRSCALLRASDRVGTPSRNL